MNPELNTQPGAVNVAVPEGTNKVNEPSAALLKIANEMTGRNFSDESQVREYFKTYNSRIGDQQIAQATKKAEQYDNVLSEWARNNGKSPEYADAFFQDYFSKKPEGQVNQASGPEDPIMKRELNNLREGYSKLESEVQKNSLLSKYPEASRYMDEITAIAKSRGQSYLDAFENSSLKRVLEVDRATAEAEKKGDGLMEPGNRRGIEPQKLELQRQKFNDRRNPVFDTDKEAFVKEYLGMS